MELIGLRDRVEALGGSIDVTSPVSHGTVIQVSLPIERKTAIYPRPGDRPTEQPHCAGGR